METVITPSPGLFAFVLRVLATADPWESSESRRMTQLTQNLTRKGARQLPYAIGEVLGLLRASMTSLQFASELIVAFNLYEAAPHLVDVTLRHTHPPDNRLLLNSASICGHPSVPEEVVSRVAEAVTDIPAALIRLDPEAPTPNEPLARLQRRCWPGRLTDDEDYGLPPTVVFDSSVDKLGTLRLSSILNFQGYAIRRVGEDGGVAEWFGRRTTVVCTAASADSYLLETGLPHDQIVQANVGALDENAINNVLSDVWDVRPSNWKRDIETPSVGEVASSDGRLSRTFNVRGWLSSLGTSPSYRIDSVDRKSSYRPIMSARRTDKIARKGKPIKPISNPLKVIPQSISGPRVGHTAVLREKPHSDESSRTHRNRVVLGRKQYPDDIDMTRKVGVQDIRVYKESSIAYQKLSANLVSKSGG